MRGRYSYIAGEPHVWLENSWSDQNLGDPFLRVAAQLANRRAKSLPGLPPFQGGAGGVFGYELSHCVEELPSAGPNWHSLPDFAVGIYLWVIAWDHLQDKAWIVVQPGGPSLNTIRNWMTTPIGSPGNRPSVVDLHPKLPALYPLRGQVSSNFDLRSFTHAVRQAIDYVHQGDCFQVNIAQTLFHPATCSNLELYERLRTRNPAPFSAYFDLGKGALLSASPERFLKVSEGEVETRPIKGTRPRGSTEEEDAARAQELANSAKDRAENVMIVDLLRNDIGRSCQYGSVQVPKVCEIESFETVHHMVSEVRGRLRPDQTPLHLLRNCFPGGSVTGAPKVRAMEIITELEKIPRGFYCGSLGFVGFDGTMDTNILIRTITSTQGWWSFPVGGGIVADSEPEKEYEETLHKAAGILNALK